jgi:hypothetical protein
LDESGSIKSHGCASLTNMPIAGLNQPKSSRLEAVRPMMPRSGFSAPQGARTLLASIRVICGLLHPAGQDRRAAFGNLQNRESNKHGSFASLQNDSV